ncbi:CaiB/BaiF CoA transferase family protein [Futiania mangrovi]|nr:CaiB/BaiF CoA-transferase family protein [Futiania mangrovii]
MGPLAGMKIIEFGGIGPGPFAAMMLSDMGADVLRLDRTAPSGLGVPRAIEHDTTRRGRLSVAVDLKAKGARELVLRLLKDADGLIEGFRPGVMERLGLGPADVHAVNPRLVYGRMTGWGQTGPLAPAVGHDINYLAISGALSMIGRQGQPPAIPLNLVADLGGGALYLVVGMLAALHSARSTGKGQVVDAAIVDGISSLLTTYYGYHAAGTWRHRLESNVIDGGAPWYNVYETKDRKYVSVGAVEGKFYKDLLKGMGLADADLPDQYDRDSWPAMKVRFAEVFATKTREEWDAEMEGLDACYAPVLSLPEAMTHPHNVARGMVRDVNGIDHPAPAPRFDVTPADIKGPPRPEGADTDAGLDAWGVSAEEREALRQAGVIG